MNCHICEKEIRRLEDTEDPILMHWTHQCGSHLFLLIEDKVIKAYKFLCHDDPFIISASPGLTVVCTLGWGPPPNRWGTDKVLFSIPRYLPLSADDNGNLQTSAVVDKIKRYLPYL